MIDLRTLGTLNVESDGRVLPSVLAQPKRLALLVYLVLAAPRGFQRRDKLLPLFWPELDEEHARSSLSQALSYLRRSLGKGVLLTRGAEEVGVDPQSIRCDVIAFEDALGRGDRERAVSLYSGPFLDGFLLSDVPELEHWLAAERVRLAQAYAQALEESALERECRGDGVAAVEWWRRVAAHDPFSSRVALRLMQSLIAAGEPVAALQHGRAHQALLAEELGIEADPEVTGLVGRLQAGCTAAPALTNRVQTGPAPRFPASSELASVITRNAAPEPAAMASEYDEAVPAPADCGPTLQAADRTGRSRWSGFLRNRRRGTGLAFFASLVLLVIATAAVGSAVQHGLSLTDAADPNADSRSPGDHHPLADRSVAVLPFENLSPSAENAYFSDGIAEEIRISLSRIDNLRVISRTSVLQYQGSRESIPTIARQLGVAHVLEGSVRREGDRVRITVQLVHAGTDEPVWSESYDRELKDIFEIQSEVAQQIAQALRANPSVAERARLAAAGTANLAAYDFYLLGRFHWNRRTSEGFRNALQYFERAIDHDREFALAYAGLADTYLMHALWSIQPHFEAVPRAKQAALRALELDSTSAEAHTSLAQVYVLEWDWLTAEQSFRRALNLNPNYATARHWYGQFLMYMARYDEAIRVAESARDIDPLSPIINADLGHVYLEARRYTEAEEQFVRTLEFEPEARVARSGLAQTYERTGRVQPALELYTRLEEAAGAHSFRFAAFHARQGRRAEGRRLLDEVIQEHRSRGAYVRPAQVARVLVALGEFDEAFAWLEKGYAERDSFMVLLLDSVDFDALRADRRFADLRQRMGFPWPAPVR